MSTVDRIIADLNYLEAAWPNLVTLKLPGTARAWVERPRPHTITAPVEPDQLGLAGVPRPAPADVDVLDLLWQIATVADDLARTVCEVVDLGPDFLPDAPASVDPRPWLAVVIAWMPQAHRDDDRTAPWVAQQLRTPVAAAARLLGDIRDGQALNAICPWCAGRSTDGTTGCRTLQVHHPSARADDEDPDELIVCFGTNCGPPSSACGQRWHGHPAWPRREWDWLASQLTAPATESRTA
ncbi:hypothetical protein G4X40_20250 [Rhodococcus sp. D2-41]|uniref:hypothetical protein n=1 Tax=Speluncibacter jeojiensis TaxID=2710754 RepID=UPI0024104A84|nr:hypothetical protein [Rhodococcus sp. D2-41]MDG3012475.1 hypothetical protein [Rhodococcus sp. D2-41]